MLYNSRSFGIDIAEVPKTVLIPYADMLNHKFPKQTTWFYDDEPGGVRVVALEDIPKGQEVCISYGDKNLSNKSCFLDYGFI